MAIIYRSAGPWGAGKGANLVAGEVDGNFFDVDRRLTTVEGEIPTLVSIAFFSVSGNSFYVHMSNGTIQGPFVLPQTTWTFRGAWAPSTIYNRNDVITANGSVYMVLFNHVSSSTTFDPGANDGLGHDYYGLMLTNPANVLPTGGLTGQILAKTANDDYAIGWQTPVVFPSQRLLEAPNATYTLTLNNIASYVRCVNASGCTILMPADATLNFPLSTEISFRQCTGGGITLNADIGVTFNSITGFGSRTARVGAVITAKKIAANQWDVFGLLGPP